MKSTQFAAGMALALLCTGAGAQVLNIAGATTLQKRLLEPGAEGLRAATGIQIKVAGINAGPGMLALFDGKVPAAAAADTLSQSVAAAMKAASAQNRSVSTLNIPVNLQYHELMRDRVVFVVNKDNTVGALTKAQLKDIHTGKIRNWADVGGPNLPITVVTTNAGGAIRGAIQRQIMDNADYVLGAATVPAPDGLLDEVSTTKGGISAVSEGSLKMAPNKARVVDAPVIERPMGLVTIGAPQPIVQKAIDFYRSPQGQKWLK